VSVASTYAEALYESAVSGGVVEDVRRDLAAFTEAIDGDTELGRVLTNPEIETRAKKAAVATLSEGAAPLVRNFLQLLLDRGRVHAVGDIRAAFEEHVAAAAGRIDVCAVTAVPLDDALRARMVERITQQTGLTVDLSEEVDPAILGGLVLRVGGVVLDASVRQRLAELRRRLAGTSVDGAVTAA
jgi:F-type H+-transporting ATPase subunit delta